MGRGFLQDFQQGVESRCGEHVDLVDDIHAVAHAGGGIDGLVPQGAHMVYAIVGGRVQLQHIQQAAVVNPQAGLTLVAGVPVHRVLAIDRLCQDFGAGGFAGAPGAGKQVGVGEAALGRLPPQRLRDMLLPDHIRKGLGPPLAIQRLIHGEFLPWE